MLAAARQTLVGVTATAQVEPTPAVAGYEDPNPAATAATAGQLAGMTATRRQTLVGIRRLTGQALIGTRRLTGQALIGTRRLARQALVRATGPIRPARPPRRLRRGMLAAAAFDRYQRDHDVIRLSIHRETSN